MIIFYRIFIVLEAQIRWIFDDNFDRIFTFIEDKVGI